MLSVLLKILAVIGIVLLILLGLVLFILLIILFDPITYKIQGQIDEESRQAQIKVHWFFGLLRFRLWYSEKLEYTLKVLWFDLTSLLKGDKKDDIKNDAENKIDDAVHPEQPAASEKEVPTTAEELPVTERSHEAEADSKMKVGSEMESASEADPDPETESATGKKTLMEKLQGIVEKIQGMIQKLKDILANISYYINLLQEEDTRDLFTHCLKVIGNILKSIRPRKLKINALFGMSSPDQTGKLYGYLCMLYPFYGEDIQITPDFERQILKGSLFCKGRIYIIVLVVNAVRILIDKKLYSFIHKLKNGGKQNGK